MQRLSSTIYNLPIFSLTTGHQVGVALRPLINPKNLQIEAWFAESNFERGLLLIPTSEIREIGRQGIAVNDQQAITPAEDLIRLKQLIQLDFQLIDKKVDSENNQRIGKVSDYSTDMESLFIQRLYVSPSALRLTRAQKIIARSQIVEITNKRIIVKNTDIVETSFFKAPLPVPEV